MVIITKGVNISQSFYNNPRPLEVFILSKINGIQYIYLKKFNDKFRLVTAMHSNGPLPQVFYRDSELFLVLENISSKGLNIL